MAGWDALFANVRVFTIVVHAKKSAWKAEREMLWTWV